MDKKIFYSIKLTSGEVFDHIDKITLIEMYQKGKLSFEDFIKTEEQTHWSKLKEFIEQQKHTNLVLPDHKTSSRFKVQEVKTVDIVLPKKSQTIFKRFQFFFRLVLIGGALGIYINDALFEKKKDLIAHVELFQPALPMLRKQKSDARKAERLFQQAMPFYIQDHGAGYKKAAQLFLRAIEADPEQVNAIGMLTSCYLNLLDFSIQNESTFFAIRKLLELATAKSLDLAETVIAEMEYYLTFDNPENAIYTVVEFTKKHLHFGQEMFYYTAYSFFSKGDYAKALTYLQNIEEQHPFKFRVHWLEAKIFETQENYAQALLAYKKAISKNPSHAKSHLGILNMSFALSKFNDMQNSVNFLTRNPELLSPLELANAMHKIGLFFEIQKNFSKAIYYIEQAVLLDSKNIDYLLDNYRLRSVLGEKSVKFSAETKMYYHLNEAFKLMKLAQPQKALVEFLQAKDENPQHTLPYIELGNFFLLLGELENAKLQFQKAIQHAKKIEDQQKAWTKYLNALLETYDWDGFSNNFQKFKTLKVQKNLEYKLQGDFLFKQHYYTKSIEFYKKAAQVNIADDSIYLNYAYSLFYLKKYPDAKFYFSIAKRFQVLNTTIDFFIAQSIAESKSIENAIEYLENQIKLKPIKKADYLSKIGELYLQKGDEKLAQEKTSQAIQLSPTLAYPWKVQAKIYLKNEGLIKGVLKEALSAYANYNKLNPSDPEVYIESYKIYLKLTNFEEAKMQLIKLFEQMPRYPNIHYYLGQLYYFQGNFIEAHKEVDIELKANPDSVAARLLYGKILLEEQNPIAAIDQFTRAIALDTASAEARQEAGWANYLLKNFMAAIALLESAIALDRANPLLYKRLGIVFRDMGDIQKACNAFKEYLKMEPDAPDKDNFSACF